jgi:glycosyltransferase involved in cell wall biosynthesis
MTTDPTAQFAAAVPRVGAGAGIVVIGRNEGARLHACLADLLQQPRPIVYVDSGSTDGSAAAARALGVDVHELDPARPFSAARARNEGVQALIAKHPGLAFVQFLDGDCIIARGWLDVAEAALAAEARCGIVFGHLREKNPQGSVYNLLCALEWRSPSGPVANFGHLGGIMMVRRSVFEQLGGFNAAVIAGEDSEFGVRVGLAGFGARKLDVPMALHDANIHRFAQWWTRAVRGGHAIGQRAQLHGHGPARDCERERRSTWFWGVLLPLGAVLAVPFTGGASLLLALAGYLALGWRVFRFRSNAGDNPHEARLYSAFNVLAKFANGIGLLKYHLNHFRGRIRIIEYK